MGVIDRDTFQGKKLPNPDEIGIPSAPVDHFSHGTVLEKRRIVHSVIDKLYNWNNLSRVSHKVLSNDGCAGVDGMGVKRWCEKEDIHLQEFRRQLVNDTYRSKPVLRQPG